MGKPFDGFQEISPMTEQQDLFADLMPKPGLRDVERLREVQEGLTEQLFLGTTSWTSEDWEGLVYPQGAAAQDYIEHYARIFGCVEVDSTWYRVPSARMVEGWLRRTPEPFRFAAKVPRVVTHEKGMVDCQGEMEEFLVAMRGLGHRLGPLLMQFAYVARGRNPHEHEHGSDFMERLARFLPQLPTGEFRFAVEVRNGKWINKELVQLLRENRAALVLNSYYTMPDIAEVRQRVDPATADFLYVRFLGDRRQMEEYVDQLIEKGEKKRRWDGLVWERRPEIERWVKNLKEMLARRPELETFVFFNNHYAGYAPGSLGMFARTWKGE